MTRRRKSRPADIASEQTLARAVRFDVALFLGTGRYATASAATLEATKVEAARPAAENPGSRCPMIYGITTEGGPVGSGNFLIFAPVEPATCERHARWSSRILFSMVFASAPGAAGWRCAIHNSR